MKINTLLVITTIYLLLSILFNYSLYQLLIINIENDQYFIILIYFLSEVFSFFFFLIPKSKYTLINSALGPSTLNDNSIDISMISNNENNLTTNLTTTSLNVSDTRMPSMPSMPSIQQQQPFVGMKCISFLIPSIFDFISKFLIFNGLKMIENEIIFRSIIELITVFFLSKLILKSKYIKFSLIGIYVILSGLIISCLFYQIDRKIKLYFNYDKISIIGMIFCLFGEVFNSFQIFFQMKYFNIGEKYCYREIAWEGLFGTIISFIFFELSVLIPCSNEDNQNNVKIFKKLLFCYSDITLKPISILLINIKNNIIWNIIIFVTSLFYSLIGAILAKYIGEVYRAGVDTGRISIIILLIVFLHTSNKSTYNIILSIIFSIIILAGIIISIFLRKQKDITFDIIPLDKSYSQDLSLIIDEDNSNLNESDIEI